MNYDEAMDAEDISPREAWEEITRHAVDFAEACQLWREFFERDEYLGSDVLGFLGY